MALSRKVDRIERELERQKKENSSIDNIERLEEALSRGFVLCKDGVERTHTEWAEYVGIDLSFLFEKDE